MDPIDYYNIHANEYFEQTVNNDMSKHINLFLEFVPEGKTILDLGCGSGRDTKYMIEQEYDVSPLDGSKEMCLLAQIHTDVEVLHLDFKDLDFVDVFDGIWACESFIHMKVDELTDVLKKIQTALITDGILCISMKTDYSKHKMEDVYFANYHLDGLVKIINQVPGFEVIKHWEDNDVCLGADWFNILVKKL